LIGDPPIAASSDVDSVTTASDNAIDSEGGPEISSESKLDGVVSQNLGSDASVADTTETSGGFALVSSGDTGSATPTSGGLQAPKADTENETTISSGGREGVGSNESGERFHLSDIAFGPNRTLGFSEDGNKLRPSQPISDSDLTAQAALLGQFVMGHFTSASDRHGGTSTGDPVIAAISNVAPIATIGHHT
jgi:hypothetical protein